MAVVLVPFGVYASLEAPDKAWVATTFAAQCSEHVDRGNSCSIEETLRILDDRARVEMGTRTLFARQSDRLAVESAYTLQPDGSKIVLSSSDIQTGDIAGDNSGFLGIRFSKLAFKDVRVGSTLVVRYSMASPGIEPFKHVSDVFDMNASRTRWDKFSVDYVSDVPLHWKVDHSDSVRARTSDGGRKLHIETTAPLYFWPEEEGKDLALRDLPRLAVSTTDSWQEFFSPLAQRIGMNLGEKLPAKAQALVDGLQSSPEEERVRRVLEDVRQRIRYMGDWRETVHGFVPFSLAEIEDRGFGDCKDMAQMTVALLRAAGVRADVAIVRAGPDNRPPLLPTLEYFNHAIVRAHVNGKTAWLDPTAPSNSLSSPLGHLQNRVSFVLHDAGGVEEDHIPLQDLQRDRFVQNIDYTPEGENWTVSAEVLRSGVVAAELVQDERRGKNQDERLAKETLPESATVLSKTIARQTAPSALMDQYPIRIEARATRLTRTSGSYQLFDFRYLSVTLAQLRDYQAKNGVSDFHLGTFSSERTIRIHERHSLEPVSACQVRSPWIDLTLEPVVVEDGVGWHATLAKKVQWISAAEMKTPQFAKTVDQLEACTNGSQLLLAKR